MGIISEEYINSLLKRYIDTTPGKQKIAKYKKDVFNGTKRGSSGMLTKEAAVTTTQHIVESFISTVTSVIHSFDRKYVHYSIRQKKSGRITASIFVDEDGLRRESLHRLNKNRTISAGEGVHDILALFTHGYTLRSRPYGVWVRDALHAAASGKSMIMIGALIHRDPNPFLKEFADQMNAVYKGICSVELNEKYIR